MLKKTIKYEDFNNNVVEEDHYFHLTAADIADMELSRKGGLRAHLEAIVRAEDGNEIMKEFKGLIQRAYGKKSEDGSRFIKNDQIWEEFRSSQAYSTLFMELVTDAEAAGDFMNGIMPADLQNASGANVDQTKANVERIRAEAQQPAQPATPAQPLGVDAAGPRRLTAAEVEAMDAAELKHLLATGQAVIG